MKRKIIILIGMFIGFIAFIYRRDLVIPQVITAQSDTNSWRATYTTPTLFHQTGKLQLNWDNSEGEILEVILTMNQNGRVVSTSEGPILETINLKFSKDHEFLKLGTVRLKQNDHMSLFISRKEFGQI